MKQRFLVIGSNSFSGSHFCEFLLEHQHEVLGVSRSPEPNPVFLPYRWKQSRPKFNFRRIDLNHQLPELMTAIHEFQPEYVVNFAAQGMVAQSWKTPEDWYQTNVVANVKLHDKLRSLEWLKKYVHVTTPEVYGSTEGWFKESFHFAPSTPYAVSRAACDLHLLSFFRAYDFPVVFTRAANVYGPGQQLYRIIPRAIVSARLGQVLPLHGGGASLRSFIHIRDVAEATYRVALRGKPGEAYHISTTQCISIRELVEKIADLTGVPFTALAQVTEDRLGKDQAYLLDSEKIRAEFAWCDHYSLAEGLKETLQWVDENYSELKDLPLEYAHKA